jgi:hypothetical protein
MSGNLYTKQYANKSKNEPYRHRCADEYLIPTPGLKHWRIAFECYLSSGVKKNVWKALLKAHDAFKLQLND